MTVLRKQSWLVQRLEKPRVSVLGKDNPFAFGGGLRNGGLSGEAMDLLRDVFAFDYMGAAEFEFGAVPEALSRLAKAELTRFSFVIPIAEVPANWRDKSKTKPEGDATIYVLCPTDLVTIPSKGVDSEPAWQAGDRSTAYGRDLR